MGTTPGTCRLAIAAARGSGALGSAAPPVGFSAPAAYRALPDEREARALMPATPRVADVIAGADAGGAAYAAAAIAMHAASGGGGVGGSAALAAASHVSAAGSQ